LSGCGGRYVDDTVFRHEFSAGDDAEVVARITVTCDECDWQGSGREAVMLVVQLDDRVVHLPTTHGSGEYRVMMGPVTKGTHLISIHPDPDLTAVGLRGRPPASYRMTFEQVAIGSPTHEAISLAPFVYARPDTVGKFNDVPLLMWYEIEPTERGRRYRYSVVFSNEDGGTPTDRLMATWGRTTDIEYIYSVEVDATGSILAEDIQGPDHQILPFEGRREGRHPLLWVATHNNMVLDHGSTAIRFAPGPVFADLKNVSREQVMDDNAWTYEVMAKELAREGKIIADAPPGHGAIPDLHRFVFLEACGEAGSNAISAGVNVGGAWHSSDRGVAEYRIVRDGCFRAAIPLLGSAGAADVSAIRFQAHAREGRPAGTSRITRLNRVFSLDERFAPGPSVITWEGSASLTPGGKPLDIPVR
jgi:hypothetical protein